MKVFVLNPPFFKAYSRESRSPAVAKSGTLYYPMWLAYAVAYLEKHGHEIMFIDAPAIESMDQDKVVEKAVEFQPQLTIVGSSTPSVYYDCETTAKIKEKVPGTFTIMVGVHVSAEPEKTLKESPDGVDAVAIREYDETVVELANRIGDGYNDELLEEIKGIAFKSKNGEIITTPERPYIADLDVIPHVSKVYKKFLDTGVNSPYYYGHSRHPIMVIITGRGCPYYCTYCVIPQTLQGHKYRKRSVEDIVEEFKYIIANFPDLKEIMIEDDTLTADRKRCRRLAEALIEAKATKIPWSCNARADVDLETMKIMKKANCRLFCVGFESGTQEILNNVKKGTKLEKIRKFREDSKKAGVLVHGCFMVGNQGETKETLESTLSLAKELSPDTAQFFPIMVYPGTAAYDYFNEQGWITTKDYRSWLTDDGLHSSVVSNPDLTYQELVDFCDRARKEFYLRPGYIFSKFIQAISSPSEAKRLFMGGATLAKYLFRPSLKKEQTY